MGHKSITKKIIPSMNCFHQDQRIKRMAIVHHPPRVPDNCAMTGRFPPESAADRIMPQVIP
jgi:hypothetical protein